jgi:hypothetical protein
MFSLRLQKQAFIVIRYFSAFLGCMHAIFALVKTSFGFYFYFY